MPKGLLKVDIKVGKKGVVAFERLIEPSWNCGSIDENKAPRLEPRRFSVRSCIISGSSKVLLVQKEVSNG